MKIPALDSADVSICVTRAEVLTGMEQKYVSSPNLKTGGFKLYKTKNSELIFRQTLLAF